MQTPLFTGFPGFIARQIMQELINQKKVNSIYAVVLPSQMKLGKEIVKKSMNVPFDVEIRLIEGDITLPNLGISPNDLETLYKEINTVWHLAALYDLAVPRVAAWKVNVHGTNMVNNFVQTLPEITRYMYFSTAYVAGTREGILREEELIRPKAFKNYYEETKYEAEVLVEKLKKIIPITIIRPGIVRGHSVTGETIKFDGPYFFINMIDNLRKLPIIPYVGRSQSFINVVPIDFLIKAVVYSCDNELASGKTLHITDPNPHPVEEVYRQMVLIVTGKLPQGRIPLALAKTGLQLHFLRKRLGVEIETLDYLTWEAQFDTTFADTLLKDSGIECADFISSLPSMIAFYNIHKKEEQYHIKIN
ncbi:SDR family oxidoreductase [Paenisporosarcina antarctica]|uniref:NAD-dependent epimerase/dehydratase family protein n=1 Tax=Paenisporosarcina antarctica TaxID=417367 RepID=A0A4P6ZYN7_9BACL|nr:SDR family oxidoreductase [Paenisporosarcina antarctica]QBP41641.1 NAD-dependent epimerase/dehydratase family protein [Paenisporosarcina antarctica]